MARRAGRERAAHGSVATVVTASDTDPRLDLERFLNRLRTRPESIEFPDTVALINRLYRFVPTGFRNDDLVNESGRNNGSCKVFAFAKLHDLEPVETLALFGAYYRADVLRQPDGDSHPNIRRFMRTGWAGIEFDDIPLRARGRHDS